MIEAVHISPKVGLFPPASPCHGHFPSTDSRGGWCCPFPRPSLCRHLCPGAGGAERSALWAGAVSAGPGQPLERPRWNRPAIHVCRPPALASAGGETGAPAHSSLCAQPWNKCPCEPFHDTRVHGVCVPPLPAQLSPMSSLGQGCADEARVPRGSWHGLCSHSSQPDLPSFPSTQQMYRWKTKGTNKGTRSTKLCLLAATAAKIVLHLRENGTSLFLQSLLLVFLPSQNALPFPSPTLFFSWIWYVWSQLKGKLAFRWS